jgi:hypothetical protein
MGCNAIATAAAAVAALQAIGKLRNYSAPGPDMIPCINNS